jgi:hypothetical protein
MNRRFVIPLAMATAVATPLPAISIIAARAENTATQPGAERMQHWAADREMILDAKLAGMKAGLKLNADQEKLWGPFQTAVENAQKLRVAAMQDRMATGAERESPIDRLDAVADRLSKAAANVKAVADAARPLYASLDETQKHEFVTLGHMLMPERTRFAETMRHRWNEGETHEQSQ